MCDPVWILCEKNCKNTFLRQPEKCEDEPGYRSY